MPAYQTSNNAYQGANQFVYQTVQSGPAPSAPTGSGGGRWFGYCPTYEEKRELKEEIQEVVREKKVIERKLQFSPNRQDLYFLVEQLTILQKRLDKLVVEFTYMMECVAYYQKLDDEEEEFLMMISGEL